MFNNEKVMTVDGEGVMKKFAYPFLSNSVRSYKQANVLLLCYNSSMNSKERAYFDLCLFCAC